MSISSPTSATLLFDQHFLEVRAKLLEVAAVFDRLDRADGSAADDPRMAGIRRALEVLLDDTGDRAEQLQLIFSREYLDDWQTQFDMPSPK